MKRFDPRDEKLLEAQARYEALAEERRLLGLQAKKFEREAELSAAYEDIKAASKGDALVRCVFCRKEMNLADPDERCIKLVISDVIALPWEKTSFWRRFDGNNPAEKASCVDCARDHDLIGDPAYIYRDVDGDVEPEGGEAEAEPDGGREDA